MRMNTQRLMLVTIAAVAVAVVVFSLVSRGGGSAGNIDLSGRPSVGSPDAPVKVAMFEDFRCNHCAAFTDQIFPRLQREYAATGQAEFVYLNFPVIEGSEMAAVAAMCVFQQDEAAFWDVTHALYRSQAELGNSRRVLEITANTAPGLDQAALQQCYEDRETLDLVRADAAQARSLNVTGTPTIFVNGERVPNYAYETVKSAIDRALQ